MASGYDQIRKSGKLENEEEVIGIDIDDEYALVSYYKSGMDEPDTLSVITGQERYQIPVILYREVKDNIWLFGARAKKAAQSGNGLCYKNLLEKAYRDESVTLMSDQMYSWEMLGIFFEKLLYLAQRAGMNLESSKVVITAKHLDFKRAKVLEKAMDKAGVKRSNLVLVDHLESFFAFTFHQTPDRWLHDVVLFEYDGRKLVQNYLVRDASTTPQMVTIKQKEFYELSFADDSVKRDLAFEKILNEEFAQKRISTVYLIGDGFEGEWMKKSLNVLCNNRKVFMGKNLYTKGACYLLMIPKEGWNYLYMGKSAMKMNLALKAKVRGEMEMISMINAGENCYGSYCACDLLLDEEPYIEIYQQNPDGSGKKLNSLELVDLPKRPKKATKVHLRLIPVSDSKVEVYVEDMGLGQIFPSSGKSWTFILEGGK